MAPSPMPVVTNDPVQARGMGRSEIRQLRRWYRDAVLRGKAAGFDIVYVYAGHGMTILMHFMQRRFNHRCDEYGGSLENRVRLTREVLEEVKEAVGDTCAVAFRFAVDELMGKDGISADGEGRVLVFDDDHYYMGGVLAELLADCGLEVTLVTPAAMVSQWTENTLGQHRIQQRPLEKGVRITANQGVAGATDDRAELECVYTGRRQMVGTDALVLVTARDAKDELWRAMQSETERCETAGIKTIEAVGDCLAPGTVAAAVYLGHLGARCLEGETWDAALFRRERPGLPRSTALPPRVRVDPDNSSGTRDAGGICSRLEAALEREL